MNLYLTADKMGEQTGGGAVTLNEYMALISTGESERLSGDMLKKLPENPFEQDARFLEEAYDFIYRNNEIGITHCYSGCLSKTVDHLHDIGSKITYTCASHSIEESKREHESLGLPYDFPHLNEPELWKKYSHGYMAADVLICPSQASAAICREQGRKGRLEVIPHGCHLPVQIPPMPKRFVVGYMGAVGPDKGLIYLLKAWKLLQDRPEARWKDELLILAGRHSNSAWVTHLLEITGAGNVHCSGWVNNISDFYSSISIYIQPSVSEGFGLEVLEAMAHKRHVLCSYGAGAHDLVPEGCKFPARDHEALAYSLYYLRQDYFQTDRGEEILAKGRKTAEEHTWDKIQARYVEIWKGLK